MNATVCEGKLTGNAPVGVDEIVSTTGVGVALTPETPSAFVSARVFVIRRTREPLVPGGSNRKCGEGDRVYGRLAGLENIRPSNGSIERSEAAISAATRARI